MKYLIECEKKIKCVYVVDAEDDYQCHEKLAKGDYVQRFINDDTHSDGFDYCGFYYKTSAKYSDKDEETVICSVGDLCEYLGTELDNLERDIFKNTECGLSIEWDDDGVTLGGYAEGADCDMPTRTLLFPFVAKEFNEALDYLDYESGVLWHEWNDNEEKDDEK